MMSEAALTPRLASLSAGHQLLEGLIRQERRRLAPDFAQAAKLKQRKLSINDKIAALSRRAAETSGGLTA